MYEEEKERLEPIIRDVLTVASELWSDMNHPPAIFRYVLKAYLDMTSKDDKWPKELDASMRVVDHFISIFERIGSDYLPEDECTKFLSGLTKAWEIFKHERVPGKKVSDWQPALI